MPVQNYEGSWSGWSERPSGCPSVGCGPKLTFAFVGASHPHGPRSPPPPHADHIARLNPWRMALPGWIGLVLLKVKMIGGVVPSHYGWVPFYQFNPTLNASHHFIACEQEVPDLHSDRNFSPFLFYKSVWWDAWWLLNLWCTFCIFNSSCANEWPRSTSMQPVERPPWEPTSPITGCVRT